MNGPFMIKMIESIDYSRGKRIQEKQKSFEVPYNNKT